MKARGKGVTEEEMFGWHHRLNGHELEQALGVVDGQGSLVCYSPAAVATKSLQSCPTLCNPIDGSPLGSSVPGILQARILEWVAISLSRGSSQSKDQTCISCNGRQILYN